MIELNSSRMQIARRRALIVGVMTLLFTFVLVTIAFANSDDGILTFAWIGTRFSEGDPDGTTGYDGQFAYFIARDGAGSIPYMDGATLRFMRIVYPLTARLLALGNSDLVPYTLVLVNILAHSIGAALVTYLLGLLAQKRAPAVLGGLIFSLWIGGLYGIRLDLHEPLCFALSLGATVAYVHKRFRLTVVLLLLAILTKELAIVFAAGLALHAFFNGKRGWSILLFCAPVSGFVLWLVILRAWFGNFPTRYPAGRGITLIPFSGLFWADDPISFFLLSIWLAIPTAVLFLIAVRYIWKKRELPLAVALLLMGAGFIMAMPGVAWEDPVAAYRVGMPIVVTGILFIGMHYPRGLKWLAALWMPSLIMLLLVPGFWF